MYLALSLRGFAQGVLVIQPRNDWWRLCRIDLCAYARQTVPASSYRKTTEIIREFPGEGQELRRLMNLA